MPVIKPSNILAPDDLSDTVFDLIAFCIFVIKDFNAVDIFAFFVLIPSIIACAKPLPAVIICTFELLTAETKLFISVVPKLAIASLNAFTPVVSRFAVLLIKSTNRRAASIETFIACWSIPLTSFENFFIYFPNPFILLPKSDMSILLPNNFLSGKAF